jgi:hypothetical protein
MPHCTRHRGTRAPAVTSRRPGWAGPPRGRSAALASAVALHLLAAAVLAGLRVSVPSADRRAPEQGSGTGERLAYVRLPTDARRAGVSERRLAGAQPAPRRGADSTSRATTTTSSVPRFRADTAAGSEVAAATDGRGAGRTDSRAAAAGVEPRVGDGRIWRPPGAPPPAPLSDGDRLDSVVTSWIARSNDSLAAIAAGARRPGDWTFEKGGRKYGMDERKIYLGKFSIPTAILALLPLNVQANPTLAERSREQSLMRADILYHAQRALGDSITKHAAARIRRRRDREREEARRIPPATVARAAGLGDGSP